MRLRIKHKNGFTLVETLVVVALFAVIGTCLLSSFLTGLKIWKTTASPNYSWRKAIIGLERLSIELRQTVNVAFSRGHPNYEPVAFWGDLGHCGFVNIVRDRIYNISYDYSAKEGTLYRSAVSAQEAAGLEPLSPRRKIIPGVKNFSFGFYGIDNTTGDAAFLDSWNYTKSIIPSAVKVAFTQEDGKQFEKVITIPIAQ